MDTTIRIAFLGTGNMGSPLAQLLARDGFQVTVWNRTAEKMAPSIAAGARAAGSPAEAVREADVVITLLGDDRAVEAVTFGDQGLLGAMPQQAIHVGMSTISPALSDRLAAAHTAHGSHYLACPIFGRPSVIGDRKGWLVAAGEEAVFAKAKPVLEHLGRGLTWVGEKPSLANVEKLAGNFLIVSAIEAMAEAFTLVEKHGLKPAQFLEMIDQVLQSPVYRLYGKLLAEGQFTPVGFELNWGLKDLRLMRQQAEAVAAPMPLADLVYEHVLSSVALGRGSWDWMAFGEVLRERAGLEGRKPPAE